MYVTYTDLFGLLNILILIVGLIVSIYNQNNKKN